MTWYSQAGQDEFVHSVVGDGGFFVDIGAYDGVEHSNTYALETEHGWDGICIEPDPIAFKALFLSRHCLTTDLAVSDHSGEITILPSARAVPCRTLTELLDLACAPPVIDYLSIDTEGHERQVLAGMDFARWQVRLITAEHNLYSDGPDRKVWIHRFLTAWGFERVVEDVVAPGYGAFEDWYQRVA